MLMGRGRELPRVCAWWWSARSQACCTVSQSSTDDGLAGMPVGTPRSMGGWLHAQPALDDGHPRLAQRAASCHRPASAGGHPDSHAWQQQQLAGRPCDCGSRFLAARLASRLGARSVPPLLHPDGRARGMPSTGTVLPRTQAAAVLPPPQRRANNTTRADSTRCAARCCCTPRKKRCSCASLGVRRATRCLPATTTATAGASVARWRSAGAEAMAAALAPCIALTTLLYSTLLYPPLGARRACDTFM